MDREKIIGILQDIHPDIDYENQENLVSDNLLDSFDNVNLVSEISDQMDIAIPAQDITPENFDSVDKLCSLIERLEEE